VLAGAAAAPVILALLPRWRALAPLFGLPGVAFLAERVYQWVANHRGRL
jgi:predicted DCC family thiol-disulfide oxidoreductase YuxK